LSEKSICLKLPEKVEILRKFAWEIEFFVKLPEKSKFLGNFPGKKGKLF